jgi:hypothetical protein
MPATPLTPVSFSRTTANGLDLTGALDAVDGTNGNSFANDGRTLLRVKNAAGAPITVSVAFSGLVDGQTVPPRTYSIPATTGDRLLGPFPTDRFGTNVTVTYSSGTSVTARVLQPGT